MSLHIVIVGAGPAGAALAHMLASRGVRVTLIERQHDFAREFRGEVIAPSGREVFRQMGLAAEFDKLPQHALSRVRIQRRGRMLVEIDLANLLGPGVALRAVSQPAMLEMLVREASRFDGFAFERGAAVRDLLRDESNGRISGVKITADGKERDIQADLVIGADGRASVTRRKAGLEQRVGPEQRFDIVWCKVPLPPGLQYDGARVFLGDQHFALAFPTYGDHLQVAWVIDKGTIGELRKRGIEEWVRQIADHVSPDLGSHLLAHLDDLTHPFLLDVVCYRLPQWTTHGLLLIGDAAHPMSPVGGQGINIALRDAVAASNELAAVARGNAAPEALDEAAKKVQAARMPEVEAIQKLQQQPPRLLFNSPVLSRVALAALPALVRTGVLPALVRPALRRMAFGIADVRLA